MSSLPSGLACTVAVVAALVLSGCQMSSDSGLLDPRASLFTGAPGPVGPGPVAAAPLAPTPIGPVAVQTDTATGSIGGPAGGLSASVGTARFSAPVRPAAFSRTADPQVLFGPWTLARSGDRGCAISLGSPNAVGDYTARTRGCEALPLASIALWAPVDDGLVAFDLNRQPILALRPTGPDVFTGRLPDGTSVTLWR
ncbi:AprI/Inh family metalloprotease inhibitor [Mongoliimonas terrestris]|uniref:AprI/Inh family metalloprotease inhibitor n=1 Tax=Mongoliimonas terrestris TaxID=1709001 RepID=UPI0009497FAD|nr:AprI/Inh family metalloprotease inhibitor [Mongoliimonas terrestris]